jgi:hypothetical protein
MFTRKGQCESEEGEQRVFEAASGHLVSHREI